MTPKQQKNIRGGKKKRQLAKQQVGKGNSQTKINQFAKIAQKEEGDRTPSSQRLKKDARGNQDKDKKKSPQGNKTDKTGDVLRGKTDGEQKRGSKVDGKSFEEVIPAADQLAAISLESGIDGKDEEQKKGSGIDGKSFGQVISVANDDDNMSTVSNIAEILQKKDNQQKDEEWKKGSGIDGKGSGIDGKSFGQVIAVANDEQAKNVEKRNDGEQGTGKEKDDNMSTGSNEELKIPPVPYKTATVSEAFDPRTKTVKKGMKGVEERKEEAEEPLDEEERNNKIEKKAKGGVEEQKEEYESEDDTSAEEKDSTSHLAQSKKLKEKQNYNEAALALKNLKVTLGIADKDGKVNDKDNSNDNEMQTELETKEDNDADNNNLMEDIEQGKTNKGKEDQIIKQVKKGGESGTNDGMISKTTLINTANAKFQGEEVNYSYHKEMKFDGCVEGQEFYKKNLCKKNPNHKVSPFRYYKPSNKKQEVHSVLYCMEESVKPAMEKMIGVVSFEKMETVTQLRWDPFIRALLNPDNRTSTVETKVRQRASWVVLKMAGTTPEIFEGWSYSAANIVSNPIANFWYACNKFIGSHWRIKLKERLGPAPTTSESSKKKSAKFSTNVEKISTEVTDGGTYSITKEKMKDPSELTVVQKAQALATRAYYSYITVKANATAINGVNGKAQIIEEFNQVYDRILAKDHTAVLITYPNYDRNNYYRKDASVYSRVDHQQRSGKDRFQNSRQFDKYLQKPLWPKIGQENWIKLYLGHNKNIHEIIDDDLNKELRDKGVLLFLSNLQAADSANAVWLMGAHHKYTETKHLMSTLQNHPRFFNLPVSVKIQKLKIKKLDKYVSTATNVVVVETSKDPDILSEVTKQSIAVWNKRSNNNLRPDGTNFTAIEWTANANMVTNKKANYVRDREQDHKDLCSCLRHIELVGVKDVDMGIEIDGETVTLRRILMTMRTTKDLDTCIFTQIHTNFQRKAVVVCHKNELEEAQVLIEFLYVFLKAKFGLEVKKWFDTETIVAAQDLEFDEAKGNIVDNSPNNNFVTEYRGSFFLSQATMNQMRKQNCTEEEIQQAIDEAIEEAKISNESNEGNFYNGEIEDDERNKEDDQEFFFQLDDTFDLTIPGMSGHQHDSGSVFSEASGATGTTRTATNRIEGNNSSDDMEIDTNNNDDKEENEHDSGSVRSEVTGVTGTTKTVMNKIGGNNSSNNMDIDTDNDDDEVKVVEEDKGGDNNDVDRNEIITIEDNDNVDRNEIIIIEDDSEDDEDDDTNDRYPEVLEKNKKQHSKLSKKNNKTRQAKKTKAVKKSVIKILESHPKDTEVILIDEATCGAIGQNALLDGGRELCICGKTTNCGRHKQKHQVPHGFYKRAKLKFEKSGPAGLLRGGCVLLKSESEQQQTAVYNYNKDSRGISSKEDTNYINNKRKNPTTGNNNDEVKDTSSLQRQGVKGDNV